VGQLKSEMLAVGQLRVGYYSSGQVKAVGLEWDTTAIGRSRSMRLFYTGRPAESDYTNSVEIVVYNIGAMGQFMSGILQQRPVEKWQGAS
jgi:hypothetical protein